jgi:hypothetical protein
MILDLFEQTETQKLTNALSGYGLNPSEWLLNQQGNGSYAIQSKTDKNFIFKGQIKNRGSKVTWEKIDLISL